MTRLVRWIIGLPEAAEDVAITVSVDRFDDSGAKTETWTRNFGGVRFSSRLDADAGVLHERFGMIRFGLGLAVRDGGLELPVVSARCCGIPLPRFLLPVSEAREGVDAEGRFTFDVKLSLPVFGLLAHYRGWLVPAPAPA